jgi:hypothetical protein
VSGGAQDDISGWTVGTLRAHVLALVAEADRRYVELRTADDLRYQQRFDAQEKAVRDALAAAKEAVTAALTAADRAVIKAEDAATKRFDAVNEFRGQLADQAAGFMPRAEYTVQHRAMMEKLDDAIRRSDERYASIVNAQTALLSQQVGSSTTGDRYRATILAVAAILVSVSAVLTAVLIH